MDKGGPAFPRACSEDKTNGDMPDGNKKIPAQDGMNLLDYFAAKSIRLVSSSGIPFPAEEVSKSAYLIAISMLEERKKYIQ